MHTSSVAPQDLLGSLISPQVYTKAQALLSVLLPALGWDFSDFASTVVYAEDQELKDQDSPSPVEGGQSHPSPARRSRSVERLGRRRDRSGGDEQKENTQLDEIRPWAKQLTENIQLGGVSSELRLFTPCAGAGVQGPVSPKP